MDLHSHELWQLVGLFVGVRVLLVLAPVLRIPYPILLVLGGLALAFVPGRADPRLRLLDLGRPVVLELPSGSLP